VAQVFHRIDLKIWVKYSNWFHPYKKPYLVLDNKTGYFIRTETTVKNPKSLGLKKPVLYLQSYLWFGLGCNDRLLNCCSDVDINSLIDGEPEIFTKPTFDHLNKKFSAPDYD